MAGQIHLLMQHIIRSTHYLAKLHLAQAWWNWGFWNCDAFQIKAFLLKVFNLLGSGYNKSHLWRNAVFLIGKTYRHSYRRKSLAAAVSKLIWTPEPMWSLHTSRVFHQQPRLRSCCCQNLQPQVIQHNIKEKGFSLLNLLFLQTMRMS